MSNHIDFYFDIISAYSYIAHKKIEKIKDNQKITFNYKPIFLGGLHNLAGISAPAFNKYKMKNMQNDCELVSKKNNISFTWNSKFPMNSLYLMRGYLCLSDDQKNNYLNTFFQAYWKDNLDLSNDEEIIKLLNTLNIDNEKFLNGIKEQSIKDVLKDKTKEEIKKEVFGAPTFIANNKSFWGQDRLEYAIEEVIFN